MKTQTMNQASSRISTAVAGLFAVMLFLTGCVVTSVCSYYTDKDVVFDPALAGNWTRRPAQADHDELWIFIGNTNAHSYTFIRAEEGKPSGNVMGAHLFELQGQLFLDIASVDQDITVIPPHYLLKASPNFGRCATPQEQALAA
jgi:hypothetical protein